ncbi:MAG: 30S ribosomal protein S6 [Acidimicrobiia bacterium]|nr:30S ribosomal protein S6 [Acidimicrobiia bacterium]
MRNYEVMTIHRPDLPEPDVQARVKEIADLLVARGAEVTDTDFWGKRRFAYEIDHLNEGYYSVVSFQTDVTIAVEELDRALGLSDAVVRHKVFRHDEE